MAATLTAITYISGYLVLLFLALCLASGLYYLAELAEEYTILTRRILGYSIWAIGVLHIILAIFEGFSVAASLLSLLTLVAYWQLLGTFPFVSVGDLKFILAIVLFLAENTVWVLTLRSAKARLVEVLAFFALLVWSVPLGLFVSLTFDDAVLPSTGGQPRKSKPSTLKSILSWAQSSVAPRREDHKLF